MAARPQSLEIKDWKKHQHYKDDRPPWIKLYGALLDDATFLGLSDGAQLQLIKVWLLASRMGHPLPYNAKLISGKIGCRGKFHMEALIVSGFLIPGYENPRESLEKSSPEVRPLSTEGREQRTETSQPSPAREPWQPVREQRVAERLTTTAGREALAALLLASGQKAAICGEIEACMDGMRGPAHQATGTEMDVALSDYVANEFKKDSKWNGSLFRGVVRRVIVASRADGAPYHRPTNADKALKALEGMN